ncbi:MAG: ATP-binding cassette domain-containing protein [Gemmatimonadales bacterium]
MLTCEALGHAYPSGDASLDVLKDINFHLDAGDFLAIVGPSGSGKTTLLGPRSPGSTGRRAGACSSTAWIWGRSTRMRGHGSGARRSASSSSRSSSSRP